MVAYTHVYRGVLLPGVCGIPEGCNYDAGGKEEPGIKVGLGLGFVAQAGGDKDDKWDERTRKDEVKAYMSRCWDVGKAPRFTDF